MTTHSIWPSAQEFRHSAVFFAGQGVIQNLSPYTEIKTPENVTWGTSTPGAKGLVAKTEAHSSATQSLSMGPVASQLAIKLLGTNEGGFFNANSAHPFEKSHTALQLCPDAVHLSDSGRAVLRVRAHGR